MTRKKGLHVRPVLMALLLVAMVAVPAVSAYSASDFATSYKETVPTRIHYYAETSVTEVMDEIYIEATLWCNDGFSTRQVGSTPMEHYYNVDDAGAYGTYSGPAPGDYQTRAYRALVKNGVVSKNWFDQNGWTRV